jgi:hypothetical protein
MLKCVNMLICSELKGNNPVVLYAKTEDPFLKSSSIFIFSHLHIRLFICPTLSNSQIFKLAPHYHIGYFPNFPV